uniref:TSA: Wollemia nobilis Ref_Wollemi_Transcript_13498_1080 transcribed RNA sequence n=1 Tax=Wollemia nobilis TaxID=56998 RepID=A0A0C9S7I0_9CONI
MGNCRSLVSATASFNVVKIVKLHGGGVEEFQRAIKAAELMLENPQHFICHSNGLRTIGDGRYRVSAPLTAEEELRCGHLYFLLPMSKLRSPLSPSEMDSLLSKADKGNNKKGRVPSRVCFSQASKIIPLLGDLVLLPHGNRKTTVITDRELSEEKKKERGVLLPKLQVEDVVVAEESWALQRYKSSGSKSWKPVLESISESPRMIRFHMPSLRNINIPSLLLSQP